MLQEASGLEAKALNNNHNSAKADAAMLPASNVLAPAVKRRFYFYRTGI